MESHFYSIFSILMGLVVGSFLNVVIHRLPLKQSLAKPRSRCPQCEAPISWKDNIPLLSFLFLRGKCRNCQAKIPFRYPFVEVTTAVLFWASVQKHGFNPETLIRDWPFLAVLVAITFIDIDHRIIPDELSIGGAIYGLVMAAIFPSYDFFHALFNGLVGFGVLFLLSWIYFQITKRVGLGGGDIKFMALLGIYLGLEGMLATILLSSLVGSVYGISVGLISREKNLMKIALPYGPFLVLGALCYYFLGEVLWRPFMTPM